MVENEPTRNLVEKAQDGDRDAFDQLATAFRVRLRSSVEKWSRYQLGPKVDVEDVLQETMFRAYRAMGRFEWQDDDSFFRWLCGIAKRALAQANADIVRAGRAATGGGAQSSGTSATKAIRRNERFDRLEAALQKLSPDHRQAIVLSRIDGLTSTEVAERMNRSPDAARQLLVRALRELKRNFGDTESLHLPDRRLQVEKDDDEE